MTREHTELLAELEKLCFARPWSQKALLDEVDNPNAYFVTAVDGDIVLGYGGMHCACKEYYMDNVAVFGHHRRKGVGSAIVEALAEMRLEYPKVSGELKEFFPKFREELERPLSRGGD